MSNVPRPAGPEDAEEDGILHLWYDPDDVDDYDEDQDDDWEPTDALDDCEDDPSDLDYCVHGVGPDDTCPECEREALKPLP
jgi:hypothetical protein